ncbi:hypothetical protein CR513_01467, partial [Mucuna pruriens]
MKKKKDKEKKGEREKLKGEKTKENKVKKSKNENNKVILLGYVVGSQGVKINRKMLPHIEFSYNKVVNSITSHSPLELVYVCSHIEKKVMQYAKKANKGKIQKGFEEGDLVWVYLRKEMFLNLRKSKILPKGYGLFKIIKKINNNAYIIDMPQTYEQRKELGFKRVTLRRVQALFTLA